MGCHAAPSQIATPGSDVAPDAVKSPPITGCPSHSVAASTVPFTPAPAACQFMPSQNTTFGDGLPSATEMSPPTVNWPPAGAKTSTYAPDSPDTTDQVVPFHLRRGSANASDDAT